MAGQTPQQAHRNFLEPVQRAISCITTVHIYTSGYDPEKKHALALRSGDPISIRTDGGEALGVSILQNYRVIESDDDERGPWKVRTTKYIYTLHDVNGEEVIAYHWHPDVPPRYPHVHVKATSRNDVRKAHLPTGRISVEEFLRVLIEDFKVRPRRSNWKKILAATQAAFERYRTWSAAG